MRAIPQEAQAQYGGGGGGGGGGGSAGGRQAGGGGGGGGGFNSGLGPGESLMPYRYGYAVQDDEGNDFNQQESSDGSQVRQSALKTLPCPASIQC